jgi:dihydroflavonol-4-reductase
VAAVYILLLLVMSLYIIIVTVAFLLFHAIYNIFIDITTIERSTPLKVFIVGGTGFIGYHTALEQLKRGNEVATVSLPDIEIGDWFPKEVKIEYGNIFEMSDDELKSLFDGYDAMVYAVGPDDRYTPKGDAYNFFYDRLVTACTRTVAAAREAGVKKCILCGSYFSYFQQQNPERKLAERHPYIRARVEQEEKVILEGKGKMEVSVLQLPYIFGTMPERAPLWKDILIKMLYTSRKIYYSKGGTAMVSVETVARAISGAIERGRHGTCYPISDENKTWVEMLNIMLKAMGMGHKKIITVPSFVLSLYGRKIARDYTKEGKQSGLNTALLFKDIMEKYSYIDADPIKAELDYTGGDIEESIIKTVKRCIEELKKDNIQPRM